MTSTLRELLTKITARLWPCRGLLMGMAVVHAALASCLIMVAAERPSDEHYADPIVTIVIRSVMVLGFVFALTHVLLGHSRRWTHSERP